MELQQIKYFLEVAKRKSFTVAAERLYVSQPMLTRTIKHLEEEFGVKLIERTSKSFRLTEAGEMLLAGMEHLMQRHNDLYSMMEDLKLGQRGRVSISSPGVLLEIYSGPLLLEFREQYPHIDIDIVEEGSKLVAQSVLSERVELGFVMLPVAPAQNFFSDLLVRDVCQLAVSREHPFAKRKSVHIRELADEEIITFSHTATLHDTFIGMCGAFGFEPRISYKTLMGNFTIELVSATQVVAVLPRPVIRHYGNDSVVTVPLEPSIGWDIALIYKRDRYQSESAKRLVKHTKEFFRRFEENV